MTVTEQFAPHVKVTGNRCQCGRCGELFNSPAAFDKHRIGDPNNRRCMSIIEMDEAGMETNYSGYWVTAGWADWPNFNEEELEDPPLPDDWNAISIDL